MHCAEKKDERQAMELKRSAAVAVTVSILLAILFGLSIGRLPAGSSGTDTWSALWIGGEGGVVKLSASDGALLRRLSGAADVRSIAVDNTGMRVWSLGDGVLSCFGFDGKKILGLR